MTESVREFRRVSDYPPGAVPVSISHGDVMMRKRCIPAILLTGICFGAVAIRPATAQDEVSTRISAHGRVVDAEGQPVAGSRVIVREWASLRYDPYLDDQNVADIQAQTTTNAAGEFRFDDNAVRPLRGRSADRIPWDVVAIADGYGMAWAHLPGTSVSEPLLLELTEERKVAGRLVGPDDLPIVGAVVTVGEIAPPRSPWHERAGESDRLDLFLSELAPTATTGANGQFELVGLPAGQRASALIRHPDYANSNVYLATTGRPQPNVTISIQGRRESRQVLMSGVTHRLERGGRIRGKVVFADTGEPVVEHSINLISDGRDVDRRTEENGRFQFANVPAGASIVQLYPPDNSEYLGVRLPVEVGSNAWDQSIQVSLPKGLAVRGTVVDEHTGEGVSRVWIAYVPPDGEIGGGWSPTENAITNRQGGFEIMVPPGPGKLHVLTNRRIHHSHDVPGYGHWAQIDDPPSGWTAQIDVSPDDPPQDVRLSVGAGLVIQGRAVDAEGQPLDRATVVTEDLFRRSSWVRRTTTDSDGRFTLRGLPARDGQWVSLTSADGSLRVSASVKADESASTLRAVELGEIRLSTAAIITGLVLGDGEPLEGATVTLSMLTEQTKEGMYRSATGGTTVTDSDGRYRFDDVEPGRRVYVRARAEGYTDAGSKNFFDLPGGQVFEHETIKLQSRVAFVAGVVVDPDGNPVKGATVSASERTGSGIYGRSISGAFTREPTAEDGRFRIEGLPNVPLVLMAYIRAPEGSKDRQIHFPAYAFAEANDSDTRILLDPKLQKPLP